MANPPLVFLSHNSSDKPMVRELAKAIRDRGIRVWIDEEDLIPGKSWQKGLEQIIQQADSAAVLVGAAGLGPWEEPELEACLTQFVRRRMPVIPVLLPGAMGMPQLPLFLTHLSWVDLRSGLDSHGLDRLESGIRERKVERRLSPEPKLKQTPPTGGHDSWCFIRRDEATPDMIREMKNYSRLVFWGISQQQLINYLKRVVDSLSEGESLKWQSIEVYFAEDSVGTMLEGGKFHENVQRSRQEIAEYLVGQINSIPKLEQVVFFHSQNSRVQTGCLMGHAERPNDFCIYYSISAIADQIPDRSLTFKVDLEHAAPTARRALQAAFLSAYEAVERNSLRMGLFHRSLWDCSVSAWSNFCQSEVQRAGMKVTCEFAKFAQGEQVLEIAAGSGDLSEILLGYLKELPKTSLTVLEGSPVMLRALKNRLGDSVQYALCRVPTKDAEDFDIRRKLFHAILIHLSIPAISDTVAGLSQLASWCSRYLEPRGRVLLSMQNTVVDLDTPDRYATSIDPYRNAMRRIAEAKNLHDYLRDQPSRFLQEEVKRTFKNDGGLSLVDLRQVSFQMNPEDRLALWKVPAILDSFINVREVGMEQCLALVEGAAPALMTSTFNQRIVGYWMFKFAKRYHK
jgi:ubiquinone/menaquinone biosynthesis C-methylase UbiE